MNQNGIKERKKPKSMSKSAYYQSTTEQIENASTWFLQM